MKAHISYANVMSTIAVFIALGGTSYAVARNSVGYSQLKRNAVTSAKVKDRSLRGSDLAASAITSSRVKDRSLRLQDLSPSARGVRGPRGEQGPAGTAGQAAPIVAREPWKALPFSAGWSNYGGGHTAASFLRDQSGQVHLRGLVTRDDGVPQGVIATLPAGYRPAMRLIFAANGGPRTVRVDVQPDGDVVWVEGNTAEKDYTSLDTVSFFPG